MTRRKEPKTNAPQPPEPFSESDVKLIRQLFLDGLPFNEIGVKFERSPVEVAEVIRVGVNATLACSFCGKGYKEVRLLIAGSFAYICDECLDVCLQIVQETRPELLHVTIGDPSPEEG